MADTIDALKSGIATIGYNLGLPGLGITEPVGTPYNVNQTPYSVYNATSGYTQPINSNYNATTAPLGYQPSAAYGGTSTNQPKTVTSGAPVTQTTNTNTQPSGAPPYASNTENQTVTYNGQTFKSDGKGGWVAQSSQPSAPSEADLNAIYNPQKQYLDLAEANLRGEFPNVEKSLADQYGLNAQTLENQRAESKNQFEFAQTQADNRKEDALSSARRLYDELRRGYGQRFGGASSAGQAASEISAVEQQRQMGQTQRSYNEAVTQLNQQWLGAENTAKVSALKLKSEYDNALNTARSDFQNKLLQISQNRFQLESAKAAAKLEALTALKNQVFAIQQQNTQYQMQIAAAKEQQQQALYNYALQLKLSGQGSETALNNFFASAPTNPSSNLQATKTGASANQAYTGSITSAYKPKDDIYSVFA